eukprot:CAMPEP_0167794642 /NCGR_PEP_ID=MMETSP0111_2-20121227/13920_1 /TAXON_ID=91324 /ORGANISM="Lotharella globosa, Strain CCCM811" /LENGTH=138 /DNA_ID=CAMNT_0007688075 /DNA_START=388 /DNA_END=801 /DNA_ORIENTATION=+
MFCGGSLGIGLRVGAVIGFCVGFCVITLLVGLRVGADVGAFVGSDAVEFVGDPVGGVNGSEIATGTIVGVSVMRDPFVGAIVVALSFTDVTGGAGCFVGCLAGSLVGFAPPLGMEASRDIRARPIGLKDRRCPRMQGS